MSLSDLQVSEGEGLGQVAPLLTMGLGIEGGGGASRPNEYPGWCFQVYLCVQGGNQVGHWGGAMALGGLSAEPLLPIYIRRIPCICQYKWVLHGCVSKRRTRLASGRQGRLEGTRTEAATHDTYNARCPTALHGCRAEG